jgi:hypothetical protein
MTLTTRTEAERSITQLLCLILGGKHANASSHLSQSLPERLELCFKLVQQEMKQAINNGDPEVLSSAMTAGQRKLTSLQSLSTLNKLIEECEWND